LDDLKLVLPMVFMIPVDVAGHKRHRKSFLKEKRLLFGGSEGDGVVFDDHPIDQFAVHGLRDHLRARLICVGRYVHAMCLVKKMICWAIWLG
jgi:hypothetical protein